NALPPAAQVSVLITTRLAQVAGARPLAVEWLAKDDAVALLCERSGRVLSEDGAAELAHGDLGGHALAISLAGAYLHKVPSMGFAEYRARLSEGGLMTTLEEAGRQAKVAITDHERSIVDTFELSYGLLDEGDDEDELARLLLGLAAFLAPGVALDRGLLRRLLDHAGRTSSPDQVDIALARLLELSLLSVSRRDAGGGAASIHALVADYVRWRLDPESARQRCRAALAAARSLFPDDPEEYWRILFPGGRAGMEELTGSREKHAAALLDRREAEEHLSALGRLAIALGDLWSTRGDIGQALLAYGRGHDSYQRRCKEQPDDLDAARRLSVSHNKIGIVLKAQGDLP
ncbi:MAG: hypothetical protein GY856_37510, partial [bacterium]|nr:hypothetical protein [bacterium]